MQWPDWTAQCVRDGSSSEGRRRSGETFSAERRPKCIWRRRCIIAEDDSCEQNSQKRFDATEHVTDGWNGVERRQCGGVSRPTSLAPRLRCSLSRKCRRNDATREKDMEEKAVLLRRSRWGRGRWQKVTQEEIILDGRHDEKDQNEAVAR